jgi:hypothetical protein
MGWVHLAMGIMMVGCASAPDVVERGPDVTPPRS